MMCGVLRYSAAVSADCLAAVSADCSAAATAESEPERDMDTATLSTATVADDDDVVATTVEPDANDEISDAELSSSPLYPDHVRQA